MARPLFGEILGKDDPGGEDAGKNAGRNSGKHSGKSAGNGAGQDDRDFGARAERVRRDFWKVLRRGARNIPFAEDAVAAYYCAFDTNTPFRVRAMLMAALAYFVMPIDVVPDFLAGLGFADDATVLMTALTMLGSHLKPVHREAARRTLAGDDAG